MRIQRFSLSRLLLVLPLLTACVSPHPITPQQAMLLDIDTSIVSPNQDSRVRSLVLHYTATNLENSLKIFQSPARQVSSHYLVPDPSSSTLPSNKVYRLVDEQQRAWHAGLSYWHGQRLLNASSIGIEIVNLGFPPEDGTLPVMQRRWYPFSEQQITLVGNLAQQIVKRHQIAPAKVVGHMDIAPQRKTDPGPLFPWKRLYEEFGIGAWPDDTVVAKYLAEPYDTDVSQLQEKLSAYGYDVSKTGFLDTATRNVVSAFQMHFRQQKFDGDPDHETLALLNALLEKYFPKKLEDILLNAPLPTSTGQPDSNEIDEHTTMIK